MFAEFVDRGILGARDALRSGDRDAAIAAVSEGIRGIDGEVLSLLRAGLDADALTRLDRWCDPKWPSVAACEEAYRKAMGARS
ncbi:hypothetical protein CLBKND_04908 [Methylorubrum aminovorans]